MDGSTEPRRTKVIAVGNQKGGVGKTSNTVHLAALAETGRKCLVWDLDMNCGSTQHFGIPDNMAILGTYEVLMGEEQPEEVIVRHGDLEEVELPENLKLLPARRNLEFIDQALTGKYGKFSDINSVLKKPLGSLPRRIRLHLPRYRPEPDHADNRRVQVRGFFLLSAMPETFAIQGLNNALKDIQSVREHGGNPKLTLIGVVLSNVDGRQTRLARELLNYVEESFAQTPRMGSTRRPSAAPRSSPPPKKAAGRSSRPSPRTRSPTSSLPRPRVREAHGDGREGQSGTARRPARPSAGGMSSPGEAAPMEDVANG